MPTKDRADFVIRQIRYYESVNCPHTIYIGDSSGQEDSEKIKNEINKLKNKINVIYEFLPTFTGTSGITAACKRLLSIVKEKYVCFTGDDDYHIPDSLTVCAEFLENNPNYATASGRAVSFRLKGNGAYGDLDSLSDYPVPDILSENAAERLVNFLSDNFVPLFFVNRTDQLLKSHNHVLEIKDHILNAEIVPSSLSIIAGKSITLDCLSFIKQVHDKHYAVPKPFDWITSPEWNESYKILESVLSESVAKKDNIPLEDALQITKQAFLAYLQTVFSKSHTKHNPPKKSFVYENILKPARSRITKTFPRITKTFPFLKYVYRVQVKPRLTGKKELHYEVLGVGSRYYKDFKPVMDSFTKL